MAEPKLYRSFDGSREYREIPNVELGAGYYGTVTSALNTNTGLPVAIKKHEVLKEFEHEHVMMSSIRSAGGHDNVVQLLDSAYAVTNSPTRWPVLVLTKCDKTIILWMGQGHQAATALVRSEMTRQMYAGLAFLHRSGITHGDLHTGNVLVHGNSGQVKIVDFGGAAALTNDYLDRLKDLRYMTKDLTLGIWNGFVNLDNIEIHRSRTHCLVLGISPDIVAQAEVIIRNRPWYLCHECARDPLVPWCGLEDTFRGIHEAIREIMSWKLSHTITGVHVPENLHEAFRYGCLLGPSEMISAPVVSHLVDGEIGASDRELAQTTIRQITNQMNATVP
eukprot:scpid85446/ scgid35162/ Mitogen-activated protein kinase 13; Mitogen-activated protein kinase p38 delta; Stress-activated protein kinase 4